MDIWRDVLDFLLAKFGTYQVIVMGVLMTLILLVLNIVKKPIKRLTDKITDVKLRKLANKSIIILSFAFAIGMWFLLNTIRPDYFVIDWGEILFTGALPIVAYAIGDGVFTPSKAEAIVKTAKKIVADDKVTTEEGVELLKVMASDSEEGEVVSKEDTSKKEETKVEESKPSLDDLLNG